MYMKLPVLDFLIMNSLQLLNEPELFMFHQLFIGWWDNYNRLARAI
jgi:hypothetical protein